MVFGRTFFMNLEELTSLIKNFVNIGPFRTMEEFDKQKNQSIKSLGPNTAALLIETILTSKTDWLLETLDIFIIEYATIYPKELTQAIANQLKPDGPPILIEYLGEAQMPEAVSLLQEKLHLDQASDELLLALGTTLQNIGNEEAATWLRKLHSRPGISAQVKQAFSLNQEQKEAIPFFLFDAR